MQQRILESIDDSRIALGTKIKFDHVGADDGNADVCAVTFEQVIKGVSQIKSVSVFVAGKQKNASLVGFKKIGALRPSKDGKFLMGVQFLPAEGPGRGDQSSRIVVLRVE